MGSSIYLSLVDTAAANVQNAASAALSKANELSQQQTGKTVNEHGQVSLYLMLSFVPRGSSAGSSGQSLGK